jgi:hypothetical protein
LTVSIREFIAFIKCEMLSYLAKGGKPMSKHRILIGGSVGKTGVMRGLDQALGRPARDFSDYARAVAATGVWGG